MLILTTQNPHRFEKDHKLLPFDLPDFVTLYVAIFCFYKVKKKNIKKCLHNQQY